jgi:ankyrin repeat domain-containing protein 50
MPSNPWHPVTVRSIVFVHGLQGHPRRTWTCERPTQLGPQVLGGATRHSHRLKKLFSRKQRTGSEDAHKVQERTVYWPLDFLADDCANSRILTWGYDSKVSNFFGGAASQSNIRAHAQNLLRALMVERLNSVSHCATVPKLLADSFTVRETNHLYCTFIWR